MAQLKTKVAVRPDHT